MTDNNTQSNYFIIDSFFSVKTSLITLHTATASGSTINQVLRPVVQTYNKATIQANTPQLSKDSRDSFKVRTLLTAPSTTPTTITYDTLHIKFPDYFVESGNPYKQVEVEICRLFDLTKTDSYTEETGIEMAASMHSDIWNMNDSADHYICSTNTLYNNPKSYTIGDNRGIYEIWFYKPDGSVVDLDPLKTRAIIEFVLKY